MPVQDYYLELLERGKGCFAELIADAEALTSFSQCHNFQSDFEKLCGAIGDRPEAQVFHLAQREYQYAMYALSIGNYRHAFISLRLFFELSLATIHFSAHELSLRKWQAKLEDIVWANLANEDTGIYSDAFIRPFDWNLAPLGKQYRTLATRVYRECSEYVHGNLHTHPEFGAPLCFKKALLMAWTEKADTIRRCVVFSYAARFLNLMQQDRRNTIESIMLDVLGEVPAVQAHYEKHVGV